MHAVAKPSRTRLLTCSRRSMMTSPAVVFEGAGDRAYSAGAESPALRTGPRTDIGADGRVHDGRRASPTDAGAHRRLLSRGGPGASLVCDLRLATTDSEFGFRNHARPATDGGGTRARSKSTDARAKELVFRGETSRAERAADWGLINRAVDADEFDDVVGEFVDDLVSGPTIALRKAKRVMNEGADESLDAVLEMESRPLRSC